MKKLILLHFALFSLASQAQQITRTEIGSGADVRYRYELTDPLEFPGYYADENGILPDNGYSYMWVTNNGSVSHQMNPEFYYNRLGLHQVTLVLTPRKKPHETSKIKVLENPFTATTSQVQNPPIDDQGLYFDTEAKPGGKLYLVVPLSSCGKEITQNYQIQLSPGLGTAGTTVPFLTGIQNFIRNGDVITFSKDWSGEENFRDKTAVFELTVDATAEVDQKLWARFDPIAGGCQTLSTDTSTVTAGPYDPNYKAADLAVINAHTDESRRIQSTNVRYTIHFQNIGEGPVDSVTVIDLLPQYLRYDGNVTSSHDVSTTVTGNRIEWVIGSMQNAHNAADIRGTAEHIPKPLPTTKGWIAFDAQIAPTEEMPIATDTCYCLCNVATVYFDSLAPINTKANIIAIGDSICFSEDPSNDKKLYVDRICYDSSNYYKETLSINDLISWSEKHIEVTVFPNPTTSEIQLTGDLDNHATIQVYDVKGILQPVAINNSQSVDLSTLPSGFYYIRVVTKEGMFSARVIKN